MTVTPLKHCYMCELDKPLDQFNSKRKECRECSKGIKLMSRYTMTQTEYDQKLKDQNNRCLICQKPESELGTLAQDHDHNCCPGPKSCGRCLRDLLCGFCNRALGAFEDDIERIIRAAEYIKRHKKGVLEV